MILGLIAQIKATAAFTAVMGSNVFLAEMPQGTDPGTVVKRIGGNSEPTFETSGFQRARVQVDFLSTNAVTAANGQAAFRAALEGFVGTLPDGTRVQNIAWIDDLDGYQYEPRQFCCTSEFYVEFTFS